MSRQKQCAKHDTVTNFSIFNSLLFYEVGHDAKERATISFKPTIILIKLKSYSQFISIFQERRGISSYRVLCKAAGAWYFYHISCWANMLLPRDEETNKDIAVPDLTHRAYCV